MPTYTKITGSRLTAALLVAIGCRYTEHNPGHCANNEGDASCEVIGDGSKPYCRRGTDECITPGSEHGCVAERPSDACYSPCGGRSTIDENGECVVTEESSSSGATGATDIPTSTSESSTGPSSTEGPTPCVSAQDCASLDAPYCDDAGVCVPCSQAPVPADGDAACAIVDPQTPVCRDDGRCVACSAELTDVCDAQRLVCDDASGDCVPCSAHDQCRPAACNLFTGVCLPKDEVLHVGPGQDYATIAPAVASFTAVGDEGTIIIHSASYNEAVSVDNERVIAFLAADIGGAATPPEWDTPAGNPAVPQLSVQTGATAFLDGLQLSGNGSSMAPGLRIDAARVWLDRSRVVQNSGGGIQAINDAQLHLRNCFVGGGTDVVGVEVIDATATILYSTVTASTFGTTAALDCTTPVAVDIRNSIIVSQGGTPPDELSCTTASVTTTATEDDIGNFNLSWFTNYSAGDYSLSAMGAAVFGNVAQWQQGDPLTDIDGDPRPTTDASPDYAGADVP